MGISIGAFLIGYLTGLGVNLGIDLGTIEAINRGLRTGFWGAALLGVGAVLGDVIICFLVFLNAEFLLRHWGLKSLLLFVGSLLLFWQGIKNLLVKDLRISSGDGSLVILCEHPLIFGFLSSILSPSTPIIALAVKGTQAGASVDHILSLMELMFGFLLGGLTWVIAFATIIRLSRAYFHKDWRNFFCRLSGLVLIVFGMALLGNFIIMVSERIF